jgi:hypothetical protein
LAPARLATPFTCRDETESEHEGVGDGQNEGEGVDDGQSEGAAMTRIRITFLRVRIVHRYVTREVIDAEVSVNRV